MFRGRRLCLILLGVLALVAVFHSPILIAYGDLLVNADPPARADAILVLAGDFSGDRIRYAGSLLRQGLAPYALISGPMPIYGVNEADLAISLMRRDGSTERLEPLYIKASSTLEESKRIREELVRRHIHSVMIVTSDYHTARAGRIFRRVLGSAMQVRVVATSSEHFPRKSWWRERESLKTVFYESLKTISSAFEH